MVQVSGHGNSQIWIYCHHVPGEKWKRPHRENAVFFVSFVLCIQLVEGNIQCIIFLASRMYHRMIFGKQSVDIDDFPFVKQGN